jgi:hypothetical protein
MWKYQFVCKEDVRSLDAVRPSSDKVDVILYEIRAFLVVGTLFFVLLAASVSSSPLHCEIRLFSLVL